MIPADRDERTRALDPDDDSRVVRTGRLAPGAVFARRYHVVAPLGSGGSGEVYQVRDVVSGLSLALKVLYPYPGQDDLERLRRELRLVRRIEHPGIVRIHDIGEADGHLYTVSDLLIGETLRDRLVRAGRLDVPEAFAILRGVLEALSMAHLRGVVHRDIKPANIFLVSTGEGGERVVLLDFGLAREAGGGGLTTVGRFLGTPEYASPEQALGDAAPTPATDVYACGITLWHMLEGAPPYVRDTDFATLLAHTREPLPLMPDVPVRVRALLAAMLAKEPGARPPDARAVLRRLDERGIRVTLRSLAAAGARGARSRRLGLLTAAASTVVIALATILALAWPRAIVLDAGRLMWKARVSAFDREVDLSALSIREAQLVPGSLPPRALLLDAGPSASEVRSAAGDGVMTPVFHEVRWPGTTPKASRARARRGTFLALQPPGFEDRYVPAKVWPIGDGPYDALVLLEQTSSFATQLVLVGDDLQGPTYHFGRLDRVALTERSGEPGRDAIILARNNVLGPRWVLFQKPLASVSSHEQSPPYLLDPAFVGLNSGWYVPLGPWTASDLQPELDVTDGIIELRSRTLTEPLRFDLATGAPLDASRRAGLDIATWTTRRDALWAALKDAAVHLYGDRPDEAATALERYVGEAPDVPEFASIALYRAALARLAAAKSQERFHLDRALDDIKRASALEPSRVPSRYLLLEAEILARLGQNDEALALASRWGSDAEHKMYVLEWLLVHLMTGERAPERFQRTAAPFGTTDVWRDLAALLVAEYLGTTSVQVDFLERVIGTRAGDIARGAELISEEITPVIWRAHTDLAAHMFLSMDPPQPVRALALLRANDELAQVGVAEIGALARVRAQVLLENRAPTDREIEDAETAARDLEEWGATDLVALYTARRAWLDVAWLAERAGDGARAARARERARRHFPDPERSG